MTIRAKYVFTITCDTCGTEVEHESDMPSADPTPVDWMSAIPAGEASMKQFCSTECFTTYRPNKPWLDDV